MAHVGTPEKTFRFKQFSVTGGGEAMGVGTDGVLLGAWAEIPAAPCRILDIGTGSGLIALMLAQRAPQAAVTGIDINAGAIAIARRNAMRSAFPRKPEFICHDIRDYRPPATYDMIVSNPPFYPTGTLGKNTARSLARSFETLTPRQLIHSARKLGGAGALFAVIVPAGIADDFEYTAWEENFTLTRRTDVVTREGKAAKRALLQFAKGGKPMTPRRDALVLQRADGRRSEGYLRLTGDFYL
jgi:tRNA1Val (adenine37-N6)-methyltransferase